jgi:hypothetical protein
MTKGQGWVWGKSIAAFEILEGKGVGASYVNLKADLEGEQAYLSLADLSEYLDLNPQYQTMYALFPLQSIQIIGRSVEDRDNAYLTIRAKIPDLTKNWREFLGIDLPLTALELDITISHIPGSFKRVAFVAARAQMQIAQQAAKVKVELAFPVGYHGQWSLRLLPPGIDFSLANLASLVMGSKVFEALPDAIRNFPSFTLASLYLYFDPSLPKLYELSFLLTSKEGNEWSVVDGLVMKKISLDLSLRLAPDNTYTYSGRIAGEAQIGQLIVSADIPLPIQGNCTLSVRSAAPLPSLGEFTQLLGGSALVDYLPPGFKDSALELKELSVVIYIDKQASRIEQLTLHIAAANPWPLWSNTLKLTRFELHCHVERSKGAWSFSGKIDGSALIRERTEVAIEIARDVDELWQIKLLAPVTLLGSTDDIKSLTGVQVTDKSTIFPAPLALPTASSALILQNLQLALLKSEITYFGLRVKTAGSLALSQYLTLTDVIFIVEGRGKPEKRIITGQLGGHIALGKQLIYLKSEKRAGDSAWVFTANTKPGVAIPLFDAINGFLPDLTLTQNTPYMQLSLQDIALRYTPDKTFSIAGSTTLTLSLIEGLTLTCWIKLSYQSEKKAEPTHTLKFNGTSSLSMQLGKDAALKKANFSISVAYDNTKDKDGLILEGMTQQTLPLIELVTRFLGQGVTLPEAKRFPLAVDIHSVRFKIIPASQYCLFQGSVMIHLPVGPFNLALEGELALLRPAVNQAGHSQALQVTVKGYAQLSIENVVDLRLSGQYTSQKDYLYLEGKTAPEKTIPLGQLIVGLAQKFAIPSIPVDDSLVLKNVQATFTHPSQDFSFKGELSFRINNTPVAVMAGIAVTHLKSSAQPTQDYQLVYDLSLMINQAKFLFTAHRSTEQSDWEYTGSLKEGTCSLTALLQKLSVDLVVPVFDWLPVVEIDQANVKWVPALGVFHFDGGAHLQWHIPFLGVQLPVSTLSATVDLQTKAKKAEDNYKKGHIYGQLNFATLTAKLCLHLKADTAGKTTVFTATLTKSEAQAIEVSALGDKLTAANQANKTVWSSLIPNSLQKLSFKEGYLYLAKEVLVDKTQEKFFLYGDITGLGQAIFLSQAIANSQDCGYVFAFSIAKGFRFKTVFSGELGALLDNLITLDSACFVVNSYDVPSVSVLNKDLDKIVSAADKPANITSMTTLEQVALPTKSLPKGLHLFAAFDFGKNAVTDIFKTLAQLRSDSQLPTAKLYVHFPKDSQSNPSFYANLAKFTLFDVIELKGPQGTDYIQLSYTPALQAAVEKYTLMAQIGVKIFNKTYAFDGNITVDAKAAVATLMSTDANQEVAQPFGLPSAIVIKKLALSLNYTFKTEIAPKQMVMAIDGTVSLFNMELTSKFGMINNELVLLTIALTKDLSLSDLMNHLLGKSWPQEGFNITFKAQSVKGSITGLYYYRAPQQEENKRIAEVLYPQYQPGFNLVTAVEINLPMLATLTIHLQARIVDEPNKKGLIAQGSLDKPIHLFIIELASDKKTQDGKRYVGSPLLQLDTTQGEGSVYQFKAGINFLNEAIAVSEVTVREPSSGKTRIAGVIKSARAVPGIGSVVGDQQLSIGFKYDEQGLSFDGWPDFIGSKVLQSETLLKGLNDVATQVRGGPCGNLANFIIDNLFTTDFALKPTFSSKMTGENPGLYLTVNGYYQIMVGENAELTKITFEKLFEIKLSDIPEISFSGLAKYIFGQIAKNVARFAEVLFANKIALAKVLGFVAGKALAKHSIEGLCNELLDDARKAVAVTVADATVTVIAAAGEVVVGAAIVTSIAKAIEAVVPAGAETPPIPLPPQWVANTPIIADNEHQQIVLKWKKAEHAVSYRIKLTAPNGKSQEKVAYQQTSTEFTIAQEDLAGEYQIQIKAIGLSGNSEWNSAQVIKKLHTPSKLSQVYHRESNTVEIAFEPVPLARMYRVVLLQGAQLIATQSANKTNFSFNVNDLALSTGRLEVKVSALGDNTHITSNESLISTLSYLGSPEEIKLTYQVENDQLNVNFKAVKSASNYVVELVHRVEGKPHTLLKEDIAQPTSEVNSHFTLNKLTEAIVGKLMIRVKAQGELTHPSTWIDSAWTSVELVRLTSPQNLLSSSIVKDNDNDGLKVSFKPVVEADRYLMELIHMQGEQITVMYAAEQGQTTASLFETTINLTKPIYSTDPTAPSILASSFAGPIILRVKALSAINNVTPIRVSSGWANAYMKRLPAPQNVVSTYNAQDQVLNVSFKAVAGASAYVAELVQLDKMRDLHILLTLTIAKPTDATEPRGEFVLSTLTESVTGPFIVRVKASGSPAPDVISSGWSSVNVVVISPPQNLSARGHADSNTLELRFKRIAEAVSYVAEVVQTVGVNDTLLLTQSIVQPIQFDEVSVVFDLSLLKETVLGKLIVRIKALTAIAGSSALIGSEWNSVKMERLTAPQNIVATYLERYNDSDDWLNVIFEAIAEADLYLCEIIQIHEGQNTLIHRDTFLQSNERDHYLSLFNRLPNTISGELMLRVKALSKPLSKWINSGWASVTIKRLAPPQGLVSIYDVKSGTLNFGFQPAAPASYVAELIQPINIGSLPSFQTLLTLPLTKSADGAELKGHFSLSRLPVLAGPIIIRVRATAQSRPNWMSSSWVSMTPKFLSTPQDVVVNCDAEQMMLNVSFKAVPEIVANKGADSGYKIELVQMVGTKAIVLHTLEQFSLPADQTVISDRVDLKPLSDALSGMALGSLVARVKAVSKLAGTNVSVNSDWVSVNLKRFAIPQNLVATYNAHNQILNVSFKGVADASTYVAELVQLDKMQVPHVLLTLPIAQPTDATDPRGEFILSTLSEPVTGPFIVRVKASGSPAAEVIISGWASVKVGFITPPQHLSASCHAFDNTLVLSFKGVSGAASYVAELVQTVGAKNTLLLTHSLVQPIELEEVNIVLNLNLLEETVVGKLTVRVKALTMLGPSVIGSEWMSVEMERLLPPQNMVTTYLERYHDSDNWLKVAFESNAAVNIYIFEIIQTHAGKNTLLHTGSLLSNKNEHYLDFLNTLPTIVAGELTLRVRALSQPQSEWINSGWASVTIKRLAPPQGLVLNYDEKSGTLNFGFQPVAKVSAYVAELIQPVNTEGRLSFQTLLTLPFTESIDNAELKGHFSLNTLPTLPDTMIVRVRASAQSMPNWISSSWVSMPLTFLSAPQDVIVNVDAEQMMLNVSFKKAMAETVGEVGKAWGYKVELVQMVGTKATVLRTLEKFALPITQAVMHESFDLNTLSDRVSESLVVRVKAVSKLVDTAVFVNSDWVNVNVVFVTPPQHLSASCDADSNTLKLSFKRVTGATRYVAELRHATGGNDTLLLTQSIAQPIQREEVSVVFALDLLQETVLGKLIVRVKALTAIAGPSVIASEWTSVEMERLAAPQNMVTDTAQYSNSDDGFKVVFEPIVAADCYLFEVIQTHEGQHTVVHRDTFPQSDGNDHYLSFLHKLPDTMSGELTLRVKALSKPLSKWINSSWADVTIKRFVPPQGLVPSYDEKSGTLNISFQPVKEATDYVAELVNVSGMLPLRTLQRLPITGASHNTKLKGQFLRSTLPPLTDPLIIRIRTSAQFVPGWISSGWASMTLRVLSAPQDLVVNCDEEQMMLNVSFKAVPEIVANVGAALGYKIELVHMNGTKATVLHALGKFSLPVDQQVISDRLDLNTLSASVSGPLVVRVKAVSRLADANVFVNSEWVSVPLTRLALPQNVVATYNVQTHVLNVSFKGVAEASAYVAELAQLDEMQMPRVLLTLPLARPTAATDELQGAFTLSESVATGPLIFRVKASGLSAPGVINSGWARVNVVLITPP